MPRPARNPPRDGPSETRPLLDQGERSEKQHYNLVGLSQRAFWILCGSMWTSIFLAAFDGTVVATLLGPISSSFLAANRASWLGTSYLLSVCCFTPIYGRLANIIGRQKSMIVSLVIFGAGNACCAAAPTMNLLIAARALAGVGGGGLQTVASIIASDIVPLSHRGIFQGYGNVIFGLGVALGPSLGGIINDTLGWRVAFWIQIPIFGVCIVLAQRFIRYTSPAQPDKPHTLLAILRRLDLPGCLLLAGWIAGLLVPISLVTESTAADAIGWSDPLIIGLFTSSAVLFLVFLVWELKLVQYPVIPYEILHRRTPTAVAVNNLVLSMVTFAQLYSIPLFFIAVRLMSPAVAGRHIAPFPIFTTIGSLGSGLIVRSTGKYYWMLFGGALCGLVSSVLLATWGTHTPEWRLWTDFLWGGLCAGSVSTLTILALVGDVGREGIATATSLSYTARMTGQVLGVGIGGAITQAVLSKQLSQRISGDGADEIIASIRASSSIVRTLDEPYRTAAVLSYEQALRAVFLFCAALAVVVVLSGLGVKEVDTRPPPPKPADGEEEA